MYRGVILDEDRIKNAVEEAKEVDSTNMFLDFLKALINQLFLPLISAIKRNFLTVSDYSGMSEPEITFEFLFKCSEAAKRRGDCSEQAGGSEEVSDHD